MKRRLYSKIVLSNQEVIDQIVFLLGRINKNKEQHLNKWIFRFLILKIKYKNNLQVIK